MYAIRSYYAGPTFRHEQFPEYKANRDATPEDIKKSVPIIQEFLQAMNIPVVVKDRNNFV